MTDLLLYDEFNPDPTIDTAISAILADWVGTRRHPPAARLGVPGRVVAFGKADRVVPGFPDAVQAARTAGFDAVVRLAGGRAAVFHEETLSFSLSLPMEEPKLGITERFELAAGLTVEALGSLGANAAIGELPGEYCPGAHSVHIDGRIKVAGFGQRLVRGAAHVGGVVVVGRSDLVRRALDPVYDALGLAWDPSTAGAVNDAVDVSRADVEAAILARLQARFEITTASLPSELLEEACLRASRHDPETR